eukprot:1066352-Pleurochrysis_carterae.AAC.1
MAKAVMKCPRLTSTSAYECAGLALVIVQAIASRALYSFLPVADVLLLTMTCAGRTSVSVRLKA